MKKLIRGILDFRKNVLPARRELFARLANGQQPDVLFITCSDSRVAPNWFASTDPGDLFVVRNVGNLVPPCDLDGRAEGETSVAAAIEFTLSTLPISDIIVCGHSGCGAMHAICNGIDKIPTTNLKRWLAAGEKTLMRFSPSPDSQLSQEDALSQRNVLQQIENLKTYPILREKLAKGEVRLHAWWFKIAEGGVYAYDERAGKYVLIEEKASIMDYLPTFSNHHLTL